MSEGGGLFQRVFRLVFPALCALVLGLFGLFFLAGLVLQGRGWLFWPPALVVFGLLWLVFKKRGSAWSSPAVFLAFSIPVLGLWVAAQVMLPQWAGGQGIGPPAWTAAEERQPIDLSGTFQTIDGKEVALSDMNGRVLFLNVWATWCGPCRVEMPDMAELYRQLAPQGLSMVAVTNEDPETVQSFLERNPYPFTILLDPQEILGRRFNISGIPTTFVIDAQGRLALRKTGSYSWASAGSVGRFRELLKP